MDTNISSFAGMSVYLYMLLISLLDTMIDKTIGNMIHVSNYLAHNWYIHS